MMLQNRNDWGTLCQWYTGHAFLNRHNFICYGIDDEVYDPMCEFCDLNYLQTPAHILAKCPSFLGLRAEIFKVLDPEPPFLFPISKVSRFLHQSGLAGMRGEEDEVVDKNTTN